MRKIRLGARRCWEISAVSLYRLILLSEFFCSILSLKFRTDLWLPEAPDSSLSLPYGIFQRWAIVLWVCRLKIWFPYNILCRALRLWCIVCLHVRCGGGSLCISFQWWRFQCEACQHLQNNNCSLIEESWQSRSMLRYGIYNLSRNFLFLWFSAMLSIKSFRIISLWKKTPQTESIRI